MQRQDEPRYQHILVPGSAEPEPYTYPHRPRGPQVNFPIRSREDHGEWLQRRLEELRQQHVELMDSRRAFGVSEERGTCLEFESEPTFDLAFKSLDRSPQGIELLSVKERGDTTVATVFVPEGKLAAFEKLVEDYLGKETPTGKPRNQPLVESISQIGLAVVESFWTDVPSLFPDDGEAVWWEVWLRAGDTQESRQRLLADFREHSDNIGIQVQDPTLEFPDRTVLLAYGTVEQFSQSVELLDCIAELRRAKELASFFTGLSPAEQKDWIEDLLGRTEWPANDAPAVCILDTGLNNQHPLLEGAVDGKDIQTCDPAWGAHDHMGHGTEMAGLCLYGDLTPLLAVDVPVHLQHRLESVKILPPPGHQLNAPELYGKITEEAVGRAEVVGPKRARTVCMAVATADFRDRGLPSSWSAAVDKVSMGFQDEKKRLIVLAAGNVPREEWGGYPDRNDVDLIHDPGQAWNALTVGAYTDKVWLDPEEFPGWAPVAEAGALGPCSTTSLAWASQWPNKPDLVMEGGNAARDPGTGDVDPLDDLQLLTTDGRPLDRLLVATGDTSAATAQVARLAAVLMARYPRYWPETIRGLLVHSAQWRPAMENHAGRGDGRRMDRLLRRYGYGVPDLHRASWSAANHLTLVCQETLQPFELRDRTRVVTKDFNLHELPWPREQLLDLGGTEVQLRVTLSTS